MEISRSPSCDFNKKLARILRKLLLSKRHVFYSASVDILDPRKIDLLVGSDQKSVDNSLIVHPHLTDGLAYRDIKTLAVYWLGDCQPPVDNRLTVNQPYIAHQLIQ